MSPEIITSLDAIDVNMNKTGMDIINIVLAFVMFGVALGIKLSTFKDILRNPKSVLTGLILQWVALPAATCLLVIILISGSIMDAPIMRSTSFSSSIL